jgi:hypothetical protein
LPGTDEAADDEENRGRKPNRADETFVGGTDRRAAHGRNFTMHAGVFTGISVLAGGGRHATTHDRPIASLVVYRKGLRSGAGSAIIRRSSTKV